MFKKNITQNLPYRSVTRLIPNTRHMLDYMQKKNQLKIFIFKGDRAQSWFRNLAHAHSNGESQGLKRILRGKPRSLPSTYPKLGVVRQFWRSLMASNVRALPTHRHTDTRTDTHTADRQGISGPQRSQYIQSMKMTECKKWILCIRQVCPL